MMDVVLTSESGEIVGDPGPYSTPAWRRSLRRGAPDRLDEQPADLDRPREAATGRGAQASDLARPRGEHGARERIARVRDGHRSMTQAPGKTHVTRWA
jgi:hypothetical protein